MSGYEYITTPATDVPIRHHFNGLINTAIFHNRSTVGTAILDFDDGLQIRLAPGEIFHIEAQDTSAQQDTGKMYGYGYTVTGDAVNCIIIEVVWTCKAPLMDREPVTV